MKTGSRTVDSLANYLSVSDVMKEMEMKEALNVHHSTETLRVRLLF